MLVAMTSKRHLRTAGLSVLACAALGAGAGVIGSAAARSGSSSGSTAGAAAPAAARGHHHRLGALRRAVHAEAVVPVRGGRFAAVSLDRGFVASVSGRTLTIREGTRKATWKTRSIDVPADAKVRLNRRPVSLADLRPGQRVAVLDLPHRFVVRAFARR
jgi:hypothetical protein